MATEEIKVQIKFTEDTPYGTFSDTLYFTEAEYAAITKPEIKAMKQARTDAWLDQIAPPLSQLKDRESALMAQIDGLEQQIISLEATLAEVRKIIAKKGVVKRKVTSGNPKCGYNGNCGYKASDGSCLSKRSCKDKE